MAKILVVDDEPDERFLVGRTLRKQGHDVTVAENGAAGLRAVRESAPDLVVTDVMMPVMGGVALIRALHSIAPDFRIIATSGLNDLATANELQAAGIGGILGKPYGARELLEAIHDQLSPRA